MVERAHTAVRPAFYSRPLRTSGNWSSGWRGFAQPSNGSRRHLCPRISRAATPEPGAREAVPALKWFTVLGRRLLAEGRGYPFEAGNQGSASLEQRALPYAEECWPTTTPFPVASARVSRRPLPPASPNGVVFGSSETPGPQASGRRSESERSLTSSAAYVAFQSKEQCECR